MRYKSMSKIDLKNKTVFLTGVAGFIGSNLAKRLFADVEGVRVVGIDNMNDYYEFFLTISPMWLLIWQHRQVSATPSPIRMPMWNRT